MDLNPLSGEERLGRVQSLVRAFGVLDALCQREGMTLSGVARTVGLPRSTTHRLLTTMEGLGYVQFDRASSRWLIGVQAFKVGAAFVQTKDLSQLGRGIMRSLMLEVQHSVNISVQEQNAMRYLSQVQVSNVRKTAARPGACLPIYSTAAGKAMMACWSETEFDRYFASTKLIARTRHTIVDRDALRGELKAVRERGYAIDDEEYDTGLRCVAAVVTNHMGAPRGSLSVSDSSIRLKRERLFELGPVLATSARQFSNQIAYQIR